jgi:hypothetical protein
MAPSPVRRKAPEADYVGRLHLTGFHLASAGDRAATHGLEAITRQAQTTIVKFGLFFIIYAFPQ